MKKIILLIAMLAAAPALADSLAEAKASGLIGEKPDGYLGVVVSSAPASTKALVADINAKRKVEYQKIAAKNGQALDVVEKLAGEKTVRMTTSGNYIMGAGGKWIKK